MKAGGKMCSVVTTALNVSNTAPTLPPIDVLLAAYNGEAFIEAQIRSILQQQYSGHLRILVRDDGSTDQTVAVVRRLMAEQLPAHRQLLLFERTEGVGHVTSNFAQLIALSEAPYIALADQDDIWLPQKLALQMQAMLPLEQQMGPVPLLVCSDLRVVDSELSLIDESFWRLQKLNPTWINDWRNLLVQNMVTGCTSLFNRAAVSVILPIPEDLAVFHDHWIATAVCLHGQVVALPEPTVLYRQHGHNVEAAHAFTPLYAVRKLKQLFTIIQRSQKVALQLGHSLSFSALAWRKLKLNFSRFFL